MYEQVSHAALDRILSRLTTQPQQEGLRYFYTRLGANFFAIYDLFYQLYGQRPDFEPQLEQLVSRMLQRYVEREPCLREKDLQREQDHAWFLSQQLVGMALYSDGFNRDLSGLSDKLDYLQELGINLVHVMPILECPKGASDGGYAVSDYYRIDDRVGTLGDLRQLAKQLHQREMLLTLDIVVNHTSDEHAWAEAARAGDPYYRDYFYTFADRHIPDQFEASMPEIFPETAPGNFTWNDDMQRWVMTVFNQYQWDLNYRNPAVLIEMLDIILFWANQGADILRLDAVAFLWKKIGSVCQNEREAHLILQLMKDCCQVTAPGVAFIAEAIVAPAEVAKYFGEDAVNAKECEIAYNATLMALMWDAVATKNARLLNHGIQSLPAKLERSTWLNYVRCHDDIGLGFDDADIARSGYEPGSHRRFLIEYFTGRFESSRACGKPFGENLKTGDARISGSLASLAGLEQALIQQNQDDIGYAIETILLLHSIIMSFGGIPLLYYGDEIGTLNDERYLSDANKMADNRWMHRPVIDWDKVAKRHQAGTPEQRIFDGLKAMIRCRKTLPVLADFNNRERVNCINPQLFVYRRNAIVTDQRDVLVVCNFSESDQWVSRSQLGIDAAAEVTDVLAQVPMRWDQGQLVIPARGYFWLQLVPAAR